MSYGLKIDKVIKIKELLKRNAAINKVTVFGSRAKGTHRPGSDIDLALFGKNISHKTFLSIKRELSDLNFAYKFDPVIYEEITNPALKEHIDGCGLVLFEKDEALN